MYLYFYSVMYVYFRIIMLYLFVSFIYYVIFYIRILIRSLCPRYALNNKRHLQDESAFDSNKIVLRLLNAIPVEIKSFFRCIITSIDQSVDHL